MPRSTDCLRCGAPRTDGKAGYCGACMDLFAAEQALGVRLLQTSWRRRQYPETGNPVEGTAP
jgi:hypothetical protein